MKNLNKLIAATFLTAFFALGQTALAEDEKQEVIPPPSSHETMPHEHEIGNSENDGDVAKDKTPVAPNKDEHHEKTSTDDTNQ